MSLSDAWFNNLWKFCGPRTDKLFAEPKAKLFGSTPLAGNSAHINPYVTRHTCCPRCCFETPSLAVQLRQHITGSYGAFDTSCEVTQHAFALWCKAREAAVIFRWAFMVVEVWSGLGAHCSTRAVR